MGLWTRCSASLGLPFSSVQWSQILFDEIANVKCLAQWLTESVLIQLLLGCIIKVCMVSQPLTEPLRLSDHEFPISWYCDLFSHWAFIENLLCIKTWTRLMVEKWVDHELWLKFKRFWTQVKKITRTFSGPNMFLVFYYIIPFNIPNNPSGRFCWS